MQPTPATSPHVHTLPDGRQVALGRTRSSVNQDRRTVLFRLANFIDKPNLPPLLDHVAPPEAFSPRMFANDRLGDCTIAGECNAVLLDAARAGVAAPPISDDDAIARYSKVDGYVPGDPSTDQGGIELDVLNDWRHDPLSGIELVAFASVDVHDTELLRYAIQLFGGVYDGIELPTTAQSQVGGLWDTVPGMVPGSWGGHCTYKCGFDYRLAVPEYLDATWGTLQRLTEAFWRAIGDEAYVLLTDEALKAPGIDRDKVLATLAQLGQVQSGGATAPT
jgi:hypothetical protein